MIFIMLFRILILLFSVGRSVANGEAQAQTPNNTWVVTNIRATRNMSDPTTDLSSSVDGAFVLYRSIAKPCPVPGPGPVDDAYKSLVQPCGWRPSPVGTSCRLGKPTENGWRTCEGSAQMPEGEQVSPYHRDKLKWRIVNITEDEATFGSLRAGATKWGIPFQSATFEVVNVIPVSS
jgi:hypothetical protein